MQIHSSHVNTGFMELSKLAWKEGRKAVLEGSRGKKAKMCYLPNCEITYFMLQAPDCSPSCRILQLPLMGFQWHVRGGKNKIQRAPIVTGKKRRPEHPFAARDDLWKRALLSLLQCSFDF